MRRLLLLSVSCLLVCTSLAAQSGRRLTYGDWTVVLSDDETDLIAVTEQDDDKMLAYRCFTSQKQCAHVIVPATSCEEGQTYPVLVNASSASLALDCVCSENENGMYEFVPTDWDGFHNILTNSRGYVGFAIPLASGQFKVVRFSLDGAKRAMAAAEAAVRKDSSEYH